MEPMFKIPDRFIDEWMSDLPGLSSLCYVIILYFASNVKDKKAQITIKEFAEILGVCSRYQIEKHIKILEKRGLVEVYRREHECITYKPVLPVPAIGRRRLSKVVFSG